LTNESLWGFALEVLEKGGLIPFGVVVIVAAWIKFGLPRASGTEAQMTAALKALEDRMQRNHETAEEHREEIRKAVSGHAERIARIEGRIDGL
jgi:hypothetical protein